MSTSGDKAGKSYWDASWNDAALPEVPRISGRNPKHFVVRSLLRFYRDALGDLPAGSRLLEVGCGQSTWLPLFARELSFAVSGLDYSEAGCASARRLLEREHVAGDVVCADMFAPPADWLGRFDVVFSNGVAEHFTDTASCLRAMAAFARPGGRVVTSVPNMRGSIGRLQKWLNRAVYDIHVPLDVGDLRRAHEAAGLEVLEARYLLSSNFGVVNVGTPAKMWRRALMAGLSRNASHLGNLDRPS